MLHSLSSTNTSYREGISFALKIYSLIYHAGSLVTLTPLCYSSTIKHIHAIQTDPCFCISCSLESSRSHTFIFAKLAVARKQKKNAGNGSVELENMQAVFLQHRKTRQEFSSDFSGLRHPEMSTNKKRKVTSGDDGNELNNNHAVFVMNLNCTLGFAYLL